MAGTTIDDTDRAILALLRENARRTVADIATRVNLSPAPVKRRIERLERLGVIVGYTVVTDETKLEGAVEAFSEIPEVQEIFTIAGDPDALVRIRVHDVDHLKHVVNILRRTEHVTGTKTLMVLDRWSQGS